MAGRVCSSCGWQILLLLLTMGVSRLPRATAAPTVPVVEQEVPRSASKNAALNEANKVHISYENDSTTPTELRGEVQACECAPFEIHNAKIRLV